MNHNNKKNSWRIRTLLVLPLICSSFLHLKAQVSSGGIPVTSVENLFFPDSLRNITIPEIVIIISHLENRLPTIITRSWL